MGLVQVLMVVSAGLVVNALLPDPSNGGVPALTYIFGPVAGLVGNGDVRVFEDAGLTVLGDTLRFAQEVRLAAMTPRADASSTGYALVDPGREYLILQPVEKGGSFTVTLEAGTYAPQWHDLTTRETRIAEQVTLERDARASFVAPFAKPGCWTFLN